MFEVLGSYRYSMPALNQLDRRVLEYLPSTAGVFLEIGANNGFAQSNTYFLERARGWRGILIEPVPHLYRDCHRLRRGSVTFNRACIGEHGPAAIDIVDIGLMSVAIGLQEETEQAGRLSKRGRSHATFLVPTARISELIDQAGETGVDFMSVDVEGAELEVLSGLDLARHTPGHLLIETRHPDKVAAMLGDRMRLREKMTQHDYLFERVEAP